MTTQNYNFLCLSQTVTPLTHMRGVAGNEALVMREPVVTLAGVQWVPKISGNALRHRLVREPGARWLMESLGLRGQLTLPQLNFLFHGGNLTEGGGRENTRLIADMQRLFPLLRLLGGAIPDQILSGSLLCWPGLLVCEENRASLASLLPEDWPLPGEPLRPAETFVSGYQYTRGDAARTAVDLIQTEEALARLRGENADGKSNLMIFSGQSVTRGACFLHGFTLQHAGDLEAGALLLSLSLWQDGGGTVGGQGSRGHGRLQTWLHGVGEQAELIQQYCDHMHAVKDEAVVWLREVFGAKVEKPAKGKRGKEAAAS